MDFNLTPSQQELRHDVRQFAIEHLRPNVTVWDDQEAFAPQVYSEMGRRGYLGSIFPKYLGGLGLGYVEYSIIVEELARIDPSAGLLSASHTSLCSNHLFKCGNDAQRDRYIPRLAKGEMIGCWSFTEPEAGSDASGMTTTAVRDGEFWVVNGTKRFTTNAMHAGVAVVMAVTDPNDRKHGISAFAIEKGTPGFRVGERVKTLGLRAVATSSIHFDDCRIPAENLVGQLGYGFIDCLKVLDGGRISIAALSLGIAQGAFDLAFDYAQKRRQFGKAIYEFQAVSHKLADMATDIEAARLLTYRACEAANSGGRFSRESAFAKLFASEVAVRVADAAVQIMGGNGLVRDFGAEKFVRDAKLCTIGEGTSEIMRLVISRQLLQAAQEQQVAEQQRELVHS